MVKLYGEIKENVRLTKVMEKVRPIQRSKRSYFKIKRSMKRSLANLVYDELFCLDFDKSVYVVDDRREDEAAVEFPSQSAPATS